jgi:hypothetical protein
MLDTDTVLPVPRLPVIDVAVNIVPVEYNKVPLILLIVKVQADPPAEVIPLITGLSLAISPVE